MTDDSSDIMESEAMRKIFIGGLSRETTDEAFAEHFGEYGTMVDKVIIKDQEQNSRGFGFITYDKSECVENVFEARPHTIDKKELDVKRATPRNSAQTGKIVRDKKLFIGGVPADLTEDDLRSYIENRHPKECGKLEKIDLIKDKTSTENKNKGFGFLM